MLVRLEGKQLVEQWSDRDVAQRWGRLFPPRDKKRQPLPVTEAWIEQQLRDPKWVQKIRKRLAKLGWFMKCLKEPLARMANREDGCRGTFWNLPMSCVTPLRLTKLEWTSDLACAA